MQQLIVQLLSLLSELADKLGRLAAILQQEQTALSQKEFAALEGYARDKEILSAEIEQLETQRHALCSQLQINNDFTSIQAFLTRVSGKVAARFEQQWNSIISLGNQCATQNQLNGILVAHQQRRTQQTLAILRGIAGGSEVYSAKGSQQKHDYQHSLGRV